MEHREEIESPLPAAKARDALVLYFQKLNYQPTRPTFLNNIEMVRGSSAVTMIAVSPRGWRSVVEAEIVPKGEGCRVLMRWDVSTLGQVCTAMDVKYLKAEMRGARALLRGREPDMVRIERQHASTLLWTIVLVIGAIALFGAAFSLLLLVVTWILALTIAAVLVTVVLILLRAPRKLSSDGDEE
jgi:hypothetical protein